MKAHRMALAGGLAVSMAAIVAGCGISTAASHNAALKPVRGGTIVVALPPQTNLTWYFPLSNSSNNTLYNGQLNAAMYLPLLYTNNKYNIQYQNSVADKVTYNPAGTVFHVFLNKKWHWSDGKPVTSADVLWTWKIIQAISAKNAPAPWPYTGAGTGDIPQGVKSVQANGPYEFTVTLKQPANQQWFIYNGLGQLQPLPMQAWNKYPTNLHKEIVYLGKEATNPNFDTVVDGPYKLASAVSSQSWKLVPNTKYSGPHALSTIILAYQGSNSSEFAALKTGAVQVGYVNLSEYGARGELKGVDKLWAGYNFGYQFLSLNLNSKAQGGMGPIFQQLYVRQALEMAIPQPAIDNSIYHGFAPPQYGPIPSKPATSFLDPALNKPTYPYNLAKAKKLLTSNGWKESGGVMTKNGQKLAFTIMYSSGDQATTDEMALIQSDFARIGVKVTLDPQPFASMVGIITNPADEGKWAAVSGIGITYGGSYPSGEEVFKNGGGLDFFGFNDPTENALITKTTQPAANAQANLKTFFKFESYTAQQLPVLFINNPGTIEAVATNVHGVNQSTLNPVTGYPLWQYWWVGK